MLLDDRLERLEDLRHRLVCVRCERVRRGAPGPRREYAWTISFVSNPGYWPANARDVAMLVPDDTTLLPLGANFSRSGVNDGAR